MIKIDFNRKTYHIKNNGIYCRKCDNRLVSVSHYKYLARRHKALDRNRRALYFYCECGRFGRSGGNAFPHKVLKSDIK